MIKLHRSGPRKGLVVSIALNLSVMAFYEALDYVEAVEAGVYRGDRVTALKQIRSESITDSLSNLKRQGPIGRTVQLSFLCG